MRTLKLSVLALSGALALASCGGGTDTPKPDTGTKPAPEVTTPETTTPVTGGTIAKPADAVAANEFVIRGERAKAMAQSLGLNTSAGAGVKTVQALGLRPLAQEDELRVLVAVTRSTSDKTRGQKRATATFVWGNGAEKVLPFSADKNNPAMSLSIYLQADETKKTTYTGGLDLQVKAPDFQAKSVRSGEYVADTGAMCAELMVNLTTAPNTGSSSGYTPLRFDTTAAPLEVCEGVTERDAEKVALEKATKNMMFTLNSVGAAPFTYVRQDDLKALPTDAAGLAAVAGTSPNATVTPQYLADFWIANVPDMPQGESKDWTPEEKSRAALVRKWNTLGKQLGTYYKDTRAYIVQTSAGREDIVFLGVNGWGVGGVKTIRFK